MEQYLNYLKSDEQHVIISQKISDIDYNMPRLMGTSKALIENVILCHQEHSSWPFGENLKLKEIFDQLFQTDQYSKFVECARKVSKKIKKDLVVEGKVLQDVQFKLQDQVKIKKNLYAKLVELGNIRQQLKTSEREILDQRELSLLKQYEEQIAVVRVEQA